MTDLSGIYDLRDQGYGKVASGLGGTIAISNRRMGG
jgi:hypothetical protein